MNDRPGIIVPVSERPPRPNPTMPWTERDGYMIRPESPLQEVRRLKWIMRHVAKLSPAGRKWLIDRLSDG